MEKIKLSDLCNPAQGQIKEQPDTIIDYIDISSVDNESKTVTGYQTMTFAESPSRARKTVKKGNILVSTVRPNLNAVAVLEDDTPNKTVASTGFCILDCKETTDKRFVFNFCRSKAFIDEMVMQATGASYPAVSDKIVRAALVPAYPYDEQRKIGEVLDSISVIIENRKRELAELDNLIKARFVEMFGKSNYPSVALKDITEVITKGTTPTTAGFGFVDDGINFFKIESIMEDHTINHEKVAHVTDECHKAFKRSQLKAGDILFSIAGAIGRTAIITERDLPGNTNQALAIIRLLSDSGLSRRFMISSFESPLVTEQYNRKKRGIAQINLSLQDIGNLVIPVPNQKAQDEFERFAQQVDKSKAAVQKALDEAQLLFDSMMQQYFG